MGKLKSNVRKVKLRTKFAVLMVTLFAVALAVNVVWTTEAQRQQTENELQEKGLVLSQQMTAMWDFMSANQEKLEAAAYGSTGSYQGLHCAVVGRSIGRLFSIESGYTTRFVNFNPRNSEDEPDEFEAAGRSMPTQRLRTMRASRNTMGRRYTDTWRPWKSRKAAWNAMANRQANSTLQATRRKAGAWATWAEPFPS